MRFSIRWGIGLLIVLIVATSGGGVLAGHTGPITIGDFEIDGNTAEEPLAGIDWDTFPEAVSFTDPEGTECAGTDDIFTTGGSKELTPGTWVFGCGSAPQKDDILSGAIGRRTVAGDKWLYVRFSRLGDNGAANVSAELNQLATTFDNDANPATPEVPERSNGDLLVFLEVTQGGAVTTPQVFEWSGTREIGVWVQTSGTPVQGVDWDAATNANAQGRWTFAEVAIKLASFGFDPGCPGLGVAWLKTNSQHDLTNGILKDRTVRKPLNLSNCATKNWEFSFNPQPIAGATVFAVYTVAGGESRSLELGDPDGDGVFRATDTLVPPGDLTFRFEVRNGSDVIWQSPEGSETMPVEGTVTNTGSLHYDISLTPDSAENFDDDPHDFTARTFEVGTDVSLPHVPVNFELFGQTPTGCGSLNPTSGTTGTGGTLTTTLSSTGPCTVSVRAWVNGSTTGSTGGFDAGEASDSSSKVFVRYAISVTPASANNETGDSHLFTVTLTRDTGSGPAGYAGQSLTLTLDPGLSNAHFTEINGQPASGTSGSCTTDASGQCAARIVATTPGDVTLTASYLAADSGGNTRTISGTGSKGYRTFAMSVTPGSATNEVGDPHTFTITLTQDSGPGPVGLAGETVTLTLNPGTSDAHFTAINGQPASGTSGSCTTDALGQCTAVITATTPGAISLTADWENLTIVEGGASASASGNKQYLAFALSVTPGSATNEVGDPHTFTITLTQDSGSGPEGLEGETITLTLDPGVSDAHFTSINGNPAAGTAGVCTTDAQGQCTAVIVASTPGAVSLTADWENLTIVEGGASESASGAKQYLAFALTATPGSATNEVGRPHTFTITLTKDSGGGPQGFAGETITLTLDPGTTDAHFTEINGQPASGTSGSCTTDASGQCSATILSTRAGSVSLTADWENQTIVVGGASATAEATKLYLDFALTVTPASAFNRVGQEHEFTVTLTQDSGSGHAGLAGETIDLTLTPAGTQAQFTEINGQPASGTSATCVTDANGECSVKISSPEPGPVTLTAQWRNETIVVGGAERSDTGDKIYIAIAVTKTACPTDTAPRGAIVTYDVGFTMAGGTLPDATFTDELPDVMEFLSAGSMGGVVPETPPVGSRGGTITWRFSPLAPGTYSATIRVRIADDAPLDQPAENTATWDSSVLDPPESATHSLLVTSVGRNAVGRAFGARIIALGNELLPITPDSNVTNPGELANIPNPLGGTEPLVSLLRVREADESGANDSAQSAEARAVGVNVVVPGVVTVAADSVLARSRSHADIGTAGSTHAGSLVQNLRVNGTQRGNISEPTRIAVNNPLTGVLLAEVLVLERIPSGAAAGVPQPDGRLFTSGLAVNGIHVIVYDIAATPIDESTDVIVSHAESKAEFTTGLACDARLPSVDGRAAAVELFNVSPDAGEVTVAEVNLPVTGGKESATLTNVDLREDLGTIDNAFTLTEGEIADGPDADTDPVEAASLAQVDGLDLLHGAITATVVKATTSSTPAGSAGDAVIADLKIAGIPVCVECEPDVNEIFLGIPEALVVLNEQIPTSDGLTVNAIHIYVLGLGNPLGLPAGAEVIISTARSGARSGAPSADGVVQAPTQRVRPRAETAPSRAAPARRPAAPAAPVVAPPKGRIRVPLEG